MANLLKAGDGRSLAHGWLGGLTWWLTTIGASAVSSFYTAHSAAIQGLPAYRSIPIGAATFVAITVGFYLLSLARRVWMSSKAVTTDAKSESEKDDRGTNDALAQAGARIGNLEQQLRVLQARDDEYGWLRDVVAEQAQHLNSLVQIVNGLISDHDLTSESPFIELRFLLKNSSVFPVSIPNFDGKLLFGNYQFDNAPTFVGKPISNLAFWHHGGFDLRQELKKHEANMILNSERKSFAFHRIDFPLVVQGNDQHQSLHMSCEITNDVLIASYPKLKIEIKQALLTPHYDFDKQTIEAVTGMLVTLQIEFRNSRASQVIVKDFKLDTSPHVERVTSALPGLIYGKVWVEQGRPENRDRLTPNLKDDSPVEADREEPIEGWIQFYLKKVKPGELNGKAVNLKIIDDTGGEHPVETPILNVSWPDLHAG